MQASSYQCTVENWYCDSHCDKNWILRLFWLSIICLDTKWAHCQILRLFCPGPKVVTISILHCSMFTKVWHRIFQLINVHIASNIQMASMTSDLISATLITLVYMSMLPQTALLMASWGHGSLQTASEVTPISVNSVTLWPIIGNVNHITENCLKTYIRNPYNGNAVYLSFKGTFFRNTWEHPAFQGRVVVH